MMINCNFGEFSVLEEHGMANKARHFTRYDQNKNSSTSFQYFDGIIMISILNWHAIDFNYFVAYTKSR